MIRIIIFYVIAAIGIMSGCKNTIVGTLEALENAERNIAPAVTLQDFPVNTFLENVIVDPDNNVFFTSYLDGKVYKLTKDNKLEMFTKIDANISGIVFYKKGGFLVTGTKNNRGFIFEVTGDGEVVNEVLLEGATFFVNGIIHLKGNHYLIADSTAGIIWEYNAKTRENRVWLDHEYLQSPLAETEQMRIGVNGIKIRDGYLYASNTQAQTIVKVKIGKNYQALEPVVYAKNILADDFVVADNGDIYAATHPLNCVVKINTHGITVIAEVPQGVLGCTALAFGKGEYDNRLYVTTNGGMFNPPENGVQEAKVVALDIQ